MKVLIITLILSLGFPAMADHHKEKFGDKWKARRDKRVEKIGAKAAMLQSHVDCIKAATNLETYSKCRSELTAKRKEFKAKYPDKK